MKKIFTFVLLLVFSTTMYAKGKSDITRNELNITQKIEKVLEKDPDDKSKFVPVKFPDGNILNMWMFFSDRFDDDVVFVAEISKSHSEREYFTKISMIYKWFLKNYKIGSIHKKNLSLFLVNDRKDYSYFYRMSVNNLKLLNNRDFGSKDLALFDDNGGMVYPIKVILRKGKFIKVSDKKSDVGVKKRYSTFLIKYDISPLIEPLIESFYEKKKTK